MKSELDAPQFANEDAAFAYVEAQLWPAGPICPHCGTVDQATKMQGKTTRKGLWNCRACRKPFTVRMGTVFESSHVPMRVWLQAIYFVCSSKKGISAHQIHRALEITYKSALAGVPLVAVNPRYTWQTCPACGCIDRKNRPTRDRFQCISCGHAGAADTTAAENISRLGSRHATLDSPNCW